MRQYSMNRSRLIGVVLAIVWGVALGWGAAAQAKTTIDVEAGFEGQFRAGRWAPVFIEVKSDRPRTGIVELRVPNASSSTMTIRQSIGLSTEPQKYVIYAPLALAFDPLRVTLFDADTDKLLAEWPDREQENINRGMQQIGFVMISAGRSPLMRSYRRQATAGSTIISHLRYPQLPAVAIGYDTADVVYLNNPEWEQISRDQQLAMLSWVRSGGTLVLYPGVDAVPTDSPLLAELPAKLGSAQVAELTEKQIKSLGLPERFRKLSVRNLTPINEAQSVDLGADLAKGYERRIGLGQLVVMPIDIGQFQFDDTEKSQRFHDGFFATFLPTPANAANENYGYYEADITAANAALERIGQIPDTGSFGFGYIAVIVGALMLIVGPIDWLILKKLGRQPWTWVTTIGWIGLFTCGAVYAGHIMRSGDLHFRTIRMFDQIGDRVIACEDIALIYAPSSDTYAINSDPTIWWQPVPSGSRYSTDTLATALDSRQSYRGNTPEGMWIDVWNWRFLRGTKLTFDAPLVDAKLQLNRDRRIVGSIQNLSPNPMTNLMLVTKDGNVTLPETIAPGATSQVDTAILATDKEEKRRYYHEQIDTSYESVFNLSQARQKTFDRLLQAGSIIVFAQLDGFVQSDVTIANPGAVAEHQALVRAVVEPVTGNPNP